MQCSSAQELFSDYLSQELDRAMTLSLENHLAACSSCSEDVAALRNTWQALNQMPQLEPPMFFHENLMSRIAAEQAKVEEAAVARRAVWDWRALFRPRQLAFGAAALVVMLAGAEVVQTTRAELGPVGWVASLFRSAPSAEPAVSAEWTPDNKAEVNGRGTLTLRLRSLAVASSENLSFSVMVPDKTDTVQAGTLLKADSDEQVALAQRPSTVKLTVKGGAYPAGKTWELPVKNAEQP